jgi:hypothetical protein
MFAVRSDRSIKAAAVDPFGSPRHSHLQGVDPATDSCCHQRQSAPVVDALLGFVPSELPLLRSGTGFGSRVPPLSPSGGPTFRPAWVPGSFDTEESVNPFPGCHLSWDSRPRDDRGTPYVSFIRRARLKPANGTQVSEGPETINAPHATPGNETQQRGPGS